MGVIYKLKPEIRDFIIKQKETNSTLSCRKLSTLLNEKFQIKVSKSHINTLIKTQGLSSLVGRRPKPKKGIIEAEGLGAYILKAADAIIGGTRSISELIKEHLSAQVDALSLAEALVYRNLFDDQLKPESGLWKLIGKAYSNQEAILSYLADLQRVTTLNQAVLSTLTNLLEEVLFLKLTLSDKTSFNLDSQFRTFWSSPNIPYDFSTTIYKIKSYINNCLKENQPIVLFTAPGYDLFPRDWLDFLIKCTTSEKNIVQVSLMGLRSQEVETITFSASKSCDIIFGLWPWQYAEYRQLESGTLSVPYFCQGKNMEFYLADSVVKLSQHFTNQAVTLRGVILRKSREAKPELFILTNIPKEKASPEDIANIYLNRWPNLQDGYRDFSRKIELFTYNTSARQPFPKDKLLDPAVCKDLKESFRSYLLALDAYARWYFLPSDYRQLDLSTTKERFYQLKAQIRKKKDHCLVSFVLPQAYPFQKDLAYATERMNERAISFNEHQSSFFTIR